MKSLIESLKGKIILAMPQLKDDFFEHSVCYICQHDEEGALGFVINKASEMREKDLLLDQKLSIDTAKFNKPILNGGPVHIERGFVIHRFGHHWRNTMNVADEIYVTTSLEMLSSIAQHEVKGDYFIALGYAVWEPGQLENELIDNDWLIGEADDTLLFTTPLEQRWQLALNRLGVRDFINLVQIEGHA